MALLGFYSYHLMPLPGLELTSVEFHLTFEGHYRLIYRGNPSFLYLALDISAYCFCKKYCISLDGFHIKTVHKLSTKRVKSWLSWDSNPRLLGGKQECYLCAMQPSLMSHSSLWDMSAKRIMIFFNFKSVSTVSI